MLIKISLQYTVLGSRDTLTRMKELDLPRLVPAFLAFVPIPVLYCLLPSTAKCRDDAYPENS